MQPRRISTSMALRGARCAQPFVAIGAALLAGCAVYPSPYTQQLELGGSGAVSIDVKQRVVFSQRVPIDPSNLSKGYQVITCAEPSPDALSVVSGSSAASLTLGTTESQKALNFSASGSEAGAFVGLRTQAIQLLRDQMYRLCEGYAAGAMNDAEFKAMQRRFQTTVLGLLAIEQLTGPVLAGQAKLTSSAQGQAGAGAGESKVVTAKADLATKEGELVTEEKNLLEKNKAIETDDEELKKIATDMAAAEKAGAQETVTTLTANQNTVKERRKGNVTARDKAQLDVDAKKRAVEFARMELLKAQSQVGTSTDSHGELRAALNLSQRTTETLSAAVQGIVSDVNAAYSRDICIELLARMALRPGIDNLSHIDMKLHQSSTLQHEAVESMKAVRTMCTGLVDRDSLDRSKEVTARGERMLRAALATDAEGGKGGIAPGAKDNRTRIGVRAPAPAASAASQPARTPRAPAVAASAASQPAGTRQ